MKAEHIGISRSHGYYKAKQPIKDWKTKQMIETVLSDHPSHGHKRIALNLGINKKRVLRVMKICKEKVCKKAKRLCVS